MMVKIFKNITIAIILIVVSNAQLLTAGTNGGGKNLALHRPYTISVPPTAKWYGYLKNAHKPLPDINTVLTDGIKCPSASFWVSNQALNFVGVAPVDVIIDLGKVQPIAEITTNHSARPNAGIVLPRKEEYFVSLDGKKFVKVAQYINSADPELPTAENKSKFFTGIKTFSSGPVKTKGRYVMVRTYGITGNPNEPGIVYANYIGHDEITVTAGNFKTSTVKLNFANAISLDRTVPATLTGYPYKRRPWGKLFAKTPLRFLLVPNSFNGSKTYQMSVGGIYVPCWSEVDNSIKRPRNITFNCSFPASIKVIDWNRNLPLTKIKNVDRQGHKITTYRYTMKYPGYVRRPFFVIKAKATRAADNIGTLTFSWSYKQEGKSYSDSESYTIKLLPRLQAPCPKRFRTGFWSGSPIRAVTHSYKTALQLFGFYQSLGFNWVDGGYSDSGIYRAVKKLGLHSNFEKGLDPNALMPGLFDKKVKSLIQKEAPFIYAPQSRRKKSYGVCPAKFISGKFDREMIELAKRRLETSHDIYDNWEPYMFLKQGCACDDCKKAFQKRYKLSDAAVNKLWPAVVTDWHNQQHNQFFSEQLAKVMHKCQSYVEAAAKEAKLGYTPSFIPSMSPAFFNPHNRWFKVHNPKDFLPGMKKIILWSYINGNNPFSAPGDNMIGNNLAFLPTWDNVLNARKKWGYKDKAGHWLPKLYFLQTEYFFAENLVAPKDYYFTSVLAFIHGFDGYGTWGQFMKQEARYLKQHIKANRLISRCENIVLDGKITDKFSVTLQKPTQTVRPVLYSRGFKYHNDYFVAVGNDHLQPIKVKISSSSLEGGQLVDLLTKQHYSGNVHNGITITMPGKSWYFFKLTK